MAANRKLQGEIDRTLKKVQEGVDIFDEIWEKVYGAQNQNQKEKFESELKSQIKKLQRYRDDIKTWITNSDIKDKRPLTDARKLIETEMERFKVCEKEFKTKAFSKEGLNQAPKEDPKEKERNKMRTWISEKLETLSSQKDAYEVEIETLNSAKKKNKKDTAATRWEDLIERCRFHEEKLEIVLRLLDNETLSAEDVEPIKDQLDYLLEQMVEGNLEEVDSIDDDSIYEELGLDDHEEVDDEEAVPTEKPVVPATPVKEEKSRKGREKEEEEKKDKRKEKASAEPVALPSINAAAMKAPPPKVKEPPAKLPVKPVAAAVPVVATNVRGKAVAQVPLTTQQPAPRVRVAAAAASEPQPGLFARAAASSQPAAPSRLTAKEESSGSIGLVGSCAGPSGVAATAAAKGGIGLPPPTGRNASQSLEGFPPASAVSAGRAAPTGLPPPASRVSNPLSSGLGGIEAAVGKNKSDPAVTGPDSIFSQSRATAGCAADAITAAARTGSEDPDSSVRVAPGLAASLVPGGGQARPIAAANLPAEVSMVIDEDETYDELSALSSELAPGAGEDQQQHQAHTMQMLGLSLQNMPEPSDSERSKTYVPRNPYPTPSSFPQTPAPVFDSAATFEKFDTDTLFFIFYYQQGTYQQYLAARELKKQSWRYHKKYLTWFQRHEEPKVTAEEYEQGTYVYFDYETGWCQRIKSEFTFEYGFLEDELQV